MSDLNPFIPEIAGRRIVKIPATVSRTMVRTSNAMDMFVVIEMARLQFRKAALNIAAYRSQEVMKIAPGMKFIALWASSRSATY
jgi:hypothetical protein